MNDFHYVYDVPASATQWLQNQRDKVNSRWATILIVGIWFPFLCNAQGMSRSSNSTLQSEWLHGDMTMTLRVAGRFTDQLGKDISVGLLLVAGIREGKLYLK